MNSRLPSNIVRVVGLLALLCLGCGPSLSPEDLGQVVFEPPNVPGADRMFPMPELDKVDPDAPKHPGFNSFPENPLEMTPNTPGSPGSTGGPPSALKVQIPRPLSEGSSEKP